MFQPGLFLDASDSNTFHVIFDSLIDQKNAVIWDVCHKKRVFIGQSISVFVGQTDKVQSIFDSDFYVKQATKIWEERVELSAVLCAKEVEEQEKKALDEKLAKREYLKKCAPSEYLKELLFPKLLPALTMIDRERPDDPLAFLSMFLLEKKKQMSN